MADGLLEGGAGRPRAVPLAEAIRPADVADVVGQPAATDPEGPLMRMASTGRIGSVILHGPPGTGKTALARALGRMMRKRFFELHAASDSVAEVRAVADVAKREPVLLFVDEIQAFNSARSDSLLRMCEEGVLDFVGATTRRPFHALTPAMVSRSMLVRFEPLDAAALATVARRAVARRMEDGMTVGIRPDAMEALCARSCGDGRRCANAVEHILAGYGRGDAVEVTRDAVDRVFADAPVVYDRAGDAHYDVTSAWIKSMRGSDPDASLLYLAHMLHAGEDPRHVARRLIVHASEDVGLADNGALTTAVAAAEAVERVGMPEAAVALAHATLHVARAPKSNSAARGIALALERVRSGGAPVVPPHLRDAHFAGAAALGHVGYAFPHDERSGWVDQVHAPGLARGDLYRSDARDGNTYEARADRHWEAVTGRPAMTRFPKDGG